MPTMSSVKGAEHDELEKDDVATFDVDSDSDLATHSDAASAVVGERTVRLAGLWHSYGCDALHCAKSG